MRLISVDLRNFRSHARTKLDFSDGVVAIIGENGAGKSSILEAINYALFPMSYRNQEELMRRGSKEMAVSLTIEIDGRQYRITRIRREGRPESKLEVKQGDIWRMIQHGSQDVNRSLEELGLRSDIFENTIYIRQGEIASLLNAKPAERKKIIGRILGTEDLEEIYEELRDVLSDIKQRESELEGEVKRISALREELESTRSYLEKKRKEREELEREEKELSREINEIKRGIEEEERKRELHYRLSAQLDEAKRKRDEKRRKRNEIEREIESKNKELREIIGEKDIKELERKARAYEPYLKYWQLMEKIRHTNDDIVRLEKEKGEIEEAIRRMPELERERAKVEGEIAAVEGELRDLERKEGELRAERNRLKEAEDEINGLKIRIDEMLKPKGIDNILILRNTLREMLTEIEELNNRISALEAEMMSKNREIAGLDDVIYMLEKGDGRCPVCSTELPDERRMEIISRKREEARELATRVEEIREEIARKREEIEGRRREADELEKLEREVDLISRRLEERQREIDSRRERIKNLEIALLGKPEKEKKLEELRKRENELNRSIGELSKYGRDLEKLNMERERREEEITRKKRELEELNREAEEIAERIREAEEIDIKREGLEKELEEAKKTKEKADKLIRDLEELRRRLNDVNLEVDELEGQVTELEKRLEEVGFKEDLYSELKTRLEGLSREKEGIVGEISKIEGEISAKEERARSLEMEIADLERKEKTLGKIKRFLDALYEVRAAFSKDGIQRTLRERGKTAIEYYSNRIFRDFGLPYEKLELTEDYGINLIRGNERFSMENLSGGEKIAAAISLRLGIALAKAGRMDFLIMDEPTVHLDDIRRENLMEIVDRLPQLGGRIQLIVVTHLKDFEAVADQIVRVRRDRSGISVVEIAQ